MQQLVIRFLFLMCDTLLKTWSIPEKLLKSTDKVYSYVQKLYWRQ